MQMRILIQCVMLKSHAEGTIDVKLKVRRGKLKMMYVKCENEHLVRAVVDFSGMCAVMIHFMELEFGSAAATRRDTIVESNNKEDRQSNSKRGK